MSADVAVHDPLDPQIRRFVAALAQAWAQHPEVESLPVAEKRRIAEIVRTPWRQGGPAMAATQEIHLPTRHGDVRVRVHRPTESKTSQPALIYLHGGGWTMFSLDTHDRVMREFAARAGAVVVGIDYALSPEAKFPLALEQIVDVVRTLHAQAGTLGLDAARLAIGGDSAGANLSVATSLVLRDASSSPLLRGMLLIYGCYTDEISNEAAEGFGAEGNLLTAAEMAEFWHNYLVRPGDALDPLAAPLRAGLAGLPPAFLIGAQCDVLAEQSRALAAKLRSSVVNTDFVEYPGATHSFLEAVSIADVADRAIADGAAWLRTMFRR
ncbi:MAG: alpha/beta hydrolase fold domain-containing protein [Rudaea sp.]|uniref:alpha/beta hydrolase fold domain-containing protein n=1 Tax=unclassified Rudaea TaxID=2627037 RepID=UPI0010F8EDA6|nr:MULTISPECIES: alpha/beta hydrolase fold domain-containing protein [unclassified Rudaea]MBN8886260.1 alpha/beta hydrolase fold domain-containing protein [Rudaea sp.]MBR0345130.1 alpha/beta hydrolase fold domain-containing protein [Rudaea sp.]